MCELKEKQSRASKPLLTGGDFQWGASAQFSESLIGTLINKYDHGCELTTEEKKTLRDWLAAISMEVPEDLCG